MFDDVPLNQNEKMICYLDSAHQNSWKTLSLNNSRAHRD